MASMWIIAFRSFLRGDLESTLALDTSGPWLGYLFGTLGAGLVSHTLQE